MSDVKQSTNDGDVASRQQTDDALRQSLEDLTRMQQISTRLLQAGDFSLLLHDILDAAIEITGAQKGNIQLLNGDRLRITAQRGFTAPFLEFFDAVHGDQTACGTALQRGERVIVEDVRKSVIFAGTPGLEVMLAAGALAVQSTPLVTRSGRVLGMFSTHYQRAPQQPSERELRLLDILARQAADVIEQKHAEESLRNREAELELVINQTPFMLTRCSRDLRYQFVSRTYAEMLGCQPGDIAGKAIVEIMGEDGFETIRPYVETVLQGTRVEFESDIRFTATGVHSLRVVYTPDTDARGHVRGWIASILDIGERKQAEDARARLLASEQAARAQAEEANRAKDEFLAIASHELRTPLNAILGWSAMLEQTPSLDGRTAKGLQSINRNTRALAQLVDDLLDASRMISGKMRLDVAPMDLGDVVDAAVETILPAASAKDISIRVVVDPASRTMTGDATRLQQTVWNLLSNAVKFTAAGGRVEVRTRLDDGQIELTVADSGIGIDAVFLPYVFDRFRQADASSTRAQGGLGLGLAIVRHLVALHGGSVRAESDGRDAGTRFVMRLPRRHAPLTARDARSPASVSATPAATDAARFDGLRILIVDDDRESCDMMLEALRRHGASVQCALSATEAIATLQEFRPDLVLSDIAMPGRDGYAVLSAVRKIETALGRRVPIAAVSAYAHAEDRQRAIVAGFDQYLAKPVDPAALASMVKTLVATPTSSAAPASPAGATTPRPSSSSSA